MEETEQAKVQQIDPHSRTASLNDVDSPTTDIEIASLLPIIIIITFIIICIYKWIARTTATEIVSLLYYVYLRCRCRLNFDFIESIDSLNMINSPDDIKQILVGSVAEGVFIAGKSDIDNMTIDKSVICCDEDCMEDINHNNYSKVYIAHRRHASPGYTLVLDLNDDDIRKTHKELKTKINELDEDIKVQTIALRPEDYREHNNPIGFPIQGPAVHMNFQHLFEKMFKPPIRSIFRSDSNIFKGTDTVYAISFTCKDILHDWFNRKRTQKWPSKQLKQQISKMRGHVVPVGMKGSSLEEYEWRICYTQAETKLVHSLNEVQLMLYFGLKDFSKKVLNEVCSDITSYVIKNLIFWLAESIPNDDFQCKKFIRLFRAALVCLRTCVGNRKLPNYMIPKRNLFAGKLASEEQAALIKKMSYWIEKCPILVEEQQRRDILPLYKDVVSRKTDKYIIQEASIKKTFKMLNNHLSKIKELEQSVNDDTFRAIVQRFTDCMDTEMCDLQDMVIYICALLNMKSIQVFVNKFNILGQENKDQ